MTVPQLYVVCLLAFVGAVFCAMQVYRALREPMERDRIVAEARARTGLPPAAPDNTPGVNLADHDECALILHTTNQHEAQLAAGCARLWDAIHEARTEEK